MIAIQTGCHSSELSEDLSADDVTAVRYGTNVSLRGAFGRYLGAAPSANVGVSVSDDSVSFLLDAGGMGLGEALECFEFVPIDGVAGSGDVLTFGSLVAIKVSRAKERCGSRCL